MLWIILALVAVLAGAAAMTRRRSYESVEDEPWRASLDEDEPLDLDEIERAEEEFYEDEGWSGDDDEGWR